MSRVAGRVLAAALLLAALAAFAFLLQWIRLPANLIGQPPATELLPDRRSGRPLQALYELQVQASRDGWTSERLRAAGDFWREAGDLTRAVAYWEAATPDAALLRDLAQADIDLGRWAEAADALDRLLVLLPPVTADRAWAQFQFGLISAAYDPAHALELLRAAEPTYGDTVTRLLPLIASAADATQVGIALAKSNLWAYAELAFSQSGDALASAYAGLARDMQGKDGSAWIAAAVAAAPNDPQVRFLQGLHLRINHDDQGSLAALVQAVALDPENPALYAELGKGYQLLGDLTSAERWLKFAVSLDANFQPLLDSFYADEQSILISLGLGDEAVLPFDATPTPGPQPTVQP